MQDGLGDGWLFGGRSAGFGEEGLEDYLGSLVYLGRAVPCRAWCAERRAVVHHGAVHAVPCCAWRALVPLCTSCPCALVPLVPSCPCPRPRPSRAVRCRECRALPWGAGVACPAVACCVVRCCAVRAVPCPCRPVPFGAACSGAVEPWSPRAVEMWSRGYVEPWSRGTVELCRGLVCRALLWCRGLVCRAVPFDDPRAPKVATADSQGFAMEAVAH